MLNCVEMCNFSPHFHAVQHYFCIGFTVQWKNTGGLKQKHKKHTKGRFFWYVSNVLLPFVSKHAKGMSLRYDAICTLGIGDAALCETPCIVADINHGNDIQVVPKKMR